MNRKEALKVMSASAGLLTLNSLPAQSLGSFANKLDLKGNINHSACRWCYGSIPTEEFFEKAKALGLKGIDLLAPSDWALANKYGLEVSMANPQTFDLSNGFNDPNLHSSLSATYEPLINQAADQGIKNIICFSGNRNRLTEEQGLENSAVGLETLVKLAEKKGIILTMELLNSKVDHKDYQCDNSDWGVALCEKIGSPNFKLLYDIYHMQIMEGNVIATIQKNNEYYNHYHTGGVPGRHEINDSQELNYPAIMKAIYATGFTGYVAQEFIPAKEDKMASLQEAIGICDI